MGMLQKHNAWRRDNWKRYDRKHWRKSRKRRRKVESGGNTDEGECIHCDALDGHEHWCHLSEIVVQDWV
jgi:hypothetical protein